MWECLLFSIYFVTASACWSGDINSKLVYITQGPVRGYKDPIEDITVFYSIPYAKAPTGPEKFKMPYTDVRGCVGHCAQTSTILDEVLPNCSDDKAIEERKSFMRERLNFITKGKPGSPRIPEWKPVRVDSFNYMDLNQNPSLKTDLLQERCAFWENIYNKFYQIPLPPEY